jgi:hypothetical protein
MRKQFIEPVRESIQYGGVFQVLAPGCVSVQWQSDFQTLKLYANLSDAAVAAAPPVLSSVFWKEGAIDDGGRLLQPWTVVWSIES